MAKLTLDGLKNMKKKALEEQNLRDGEKDWKVTVHMGTCGIAAGARDVLQALLDELNVRKTNNVMVVQAGCVGMCEQEPIITVQHLDDTPVKYAKLNNEKVRTIVAQHIVNGSPVEDYMIK